ncbi:unnamed protein product [Penicillium bialowiezense]
MTNRMQEDYPEGPIRLTRLVPHAQAQTSNVVGTSESLSKEMQDLGDFEPSDFANGQKDINYPANSTQPIGGSSFLIASLQDLPWIPISHQMSGGILTSIAIALRY